MASLKKFRYLAYSMEGARHNATVRAPTLEDAQRVLWEGGLRIVQIKEREFKRPRLHELFPTFVKVRKSELILLTRQLATFVKVGVPILEAIAVLHEQTSSRQLKAALEELLVDLGEGRSLSGALARHPRIFSSLYVDMVKAAEISGELDVVLTQLAEYMMREDTATRRIRSAMIYPAVVLLLSLAVVTILVTFVLPAFVHLFDEFHAELPLPTRVLLSIGKFMEGNRLQVALGIALLVAAAALFLRSGPGKKATDRYILSVPYLGKVIRYSIIERFLRTFSAMTRAGIPVTQMFDTVIQSTGNGLFQERLRKVREMMLAGEGYSEPLRQTQLFPMLVIQMVRVGEETGTLDHNLEQAAEYFATEIDFRIKAMISVMEPGLVIFVGIVVGFVAISVITPMYGLVRAIK